jgi:DNA-binding CsgD family transcriptional regulator
MMESELTPTERKVAELVAQGRRNTEVAKALGVSAKTVEYHLTRVYRKLGVRSRIDLALLVAGASRDPGFSRGLRGARE